MSDAARERLHRTEVGDRYQDPITGDWFEVTEVRSGMLPTPIDPRVSTRLGQSAAACADRGKTRNPTMQEGRRGK